MKFYFCAVKITLLCLSVSIKIHDLTDLKEMYAIVTLDEETKGMKSFLMHIDALYMCLKKKKCAYSVNTHSCLSQALISCVGLMMGSC